MRLKRILWVWSLTFVVKVQAQFPSQTDSLKQAVAEATGKGRVEALNALAWSFRTQAADSLLHYADLALQQAQQLSDYQGMALSNNRIGWGCYMNGDFANALKYLHKAYELAEEHQLTQELSRTYNTLGIVHKSRGNFRTARKYLERALALRKQAANHVGVANVLSNLGNVARHQGKYEQALASHREALQLRRQYDRSQLGSSFQNLGNLYFELDSFSKAANYYARASAYFESQQQLLNSASCLNNLGLTQIYQSLYKTAKTTLDSSIALFASLNNQYGVSKAFRNLGLLLEFEGDLASAKYYYTRSLEIAVELEDQQGILISYRNLGDVSLARKQLDSALICYDSCLKLSYTLGDLRQQYYAMQGQAQCMELQQQWQQANAHYKALLPLADTLAIRTKNEALTELLLRFEAEEQEYALLMARQSRDLDTAQRGQRFWLWLAIAILGLSLVFWWWYRYRQRLRTLKLLEQMRQQEHRNIGDYLHDSVAVVFSNLRMNLDHLREYVPVGNAKATAYFNKADKMALKAATMVRDTSHQLIRDQLLDQGLQANLDSLCKEINQNGSLEVSCFIAGNIARVPTAHTLLLNRCARELMNNTLKHAQATKAKIVLRVDKQAVVIQVTDNGVGIDPESEEFKLGIGINRLKIQVESLSGTLAIANDKGAKITIQLPL